MDLFANLEHSFFANFEQVKINSYCANFKQVWVVIQYRQTICNNNNIHIYIYMYSECLLMKFYQVFKIYKRFEKEREKILAQQSMRKEKLTKVGLCFITGRFIKSFKMIIRSAIFAF